MDNKKPNDWVLNVLQNPEFSLSDFKAVGIDGDNTSIEERDIYANNKIIQSNPQFQTNGEFDNSKFNSFYDNALQTYQFLATNTFNDTSVQDAVFGENNIWAPVESHKKETPEFQITKIFNPDRRNIGIERIGYTSDRTKSPEEIAQTQKVYDPETRTWDEAPNETWLSRNWLEPVALAQWESDGTHIDPTTKRQVKHKKGQLRFNEEGTYFYEKLGDKEPYGRQLLSPFDILTVDGSKANKYDFFDSDGLDKDIFGSVMKNTAKIAPMFLPYVGPVYIGLGITHELSKVLPAIYKTTFGLAGASNSWVNKLEGFAYSLDTGSSEYARKNPWAMENILNMVGDVAKQLYEQRWIFTNAPRMFKPYGISSKNGTSELDKQIAKKAQEYASTSIQDMPKVLKTLSETGSMDAVEDLIKKEAFARATIWGQKYMDSYQKWGKELSRLYMTGTSSYNAFSDAKMEGASDKEAAAVFWGYMAGMYALMGTDIGSHVLPELRLDKQRVKELITKVGESTAKQFADNSIQATEKEISKNIFAKLFNGAKNIAMNHKNAIAQGSTSMISNSLAEGVEEVSEEVLYDATKATFNLISYLTGNETQLSAFNDMGARYGMSFFGGALGGGIFQGINDIKLRKSYDSGNMQANQELIYLIRQGRGGEIHKALDDMRKKGILGNKNLSATKKEKVDGKYLYQQGTDDDNQNDAVYSLMNDYVSNIEEVLSVEGMKVPDDALIDKQILSEVRYQELLKNAPATGKILQDFNNLADKFLEVHSGIDQLNATYATSEQRKEKAYIDGMTAFNQKLDELKKQQYDFLHTGMRGKYLGMMMFSTNPYINKPFIDMTFRNFAETKYNKDFSQLSDDDIEKAKVEYSDYLEYDINDKLDLAYEVFNNLNIKLSPLFQETGELSYKNYAQVRQAFYNAQMGLTDEEGNVKPVSISSLLSNMFGDETSTDEEVLEKAEKLKKTKVTPFNEISKFLTYTTQDANGMPITNASIILQQMNDAADSMIADGYIDKEVAGVMRSIVDNIVSVNKELFYDIFDNASFSVSEDIGNIIRDWVINTDLTVDNIVEKTGELIADLKEMKPSLQEAQAQNLDTIISDLTEEANRIENSNLSILEQTSTLMNKLEHSKSNPLYDLLSKIELNVIGKKTNVFDLLQELEQKFDETHISDFALDNKLQIEQIAAAKKVLEATRSVIYASQYDNIDALNPFGYNASLKGFYEKNKIEDAPELGLIDSETAFLMNKDLQKIEMKLDFIERISNLNKQSQLKEQKRTSVNMNYLFYDIIGNEDSFLYSKVVNNVTSARTINGKELLDDKVREAINNATTLKQYTEDQDRNLDIEKEDLIAIEKEKVAIEDALYDRFQEISEGMDQTTALKELLFDGGFSIKDILERSKGIRSNTKSLIGSEKLAYITSIFGIKSSDFLSKYYNVIKDLKIAPLASQEFGIRLGYTLISNMSFINNILDAADIPSHTPGTVLKNSIFIEGVPGAGKSTATAKVIYLMAKADDANVKTWTVGPKLKQATNLSINLGAENNTIYSSETLFEHLKVNPEEVNGNSNIQIVTSPTGIKNIEIKGIETREYPKTNVPAIIFIDEVTHFTNGELQIITDFASKNNVAVITLGDTEQSGKSNLWELMDGKYPVKVINSFNTTFMLSSAKQSISMRATNINKRDNLNNTRSVMDMVRVTNQNLTVAQKWETINEHLELKYTKDKLGIHGEILQNKLSNEDLEILLNNLEKDDVIGYVYENKDSETYKMLSTLSEELKGRIKFQSAEEFQKKIESYTEEEVQGSEAKFFIIDIDWNKKRTLYNDSAEAHIEVESFMKSLHTINTRSEEGTIIIDNKFSDIVSPKVFVKSDYNTAIGYTDESLIDFRDNRLEALDEILKNYKPTEPKEPKKELKVEPKLHVNDWIQLADGSQWRVTSIDKNYVVADINKVVYKAVAFDAIDNLLGTKIKKIPDPTIKSKKEPQGRPDLQAALLAAALSAEKESYAEIEKRKQWYAKEDPGFKVYTFAGYRSGLDVARDSSGKEIIDSNNEVTVVSSGRSVMIDGTNKWEPVADLQAILNIGFFQNGNTKIPFGKYDTAKNILADIRSAIMFAPTNAAALSQTKILLNPLSKSLSRATASGELHVKLIKQFKSSTDHTLEMGDPITPNRKLLVYVLKDNKGNAIAEFTIGVLPSVYTLDNWVQNYKGNDPNIRTKWKRLSKLSGNINTALKDNIKGSAYIPLGTDFSLGPNIISNTKIHKVDEHGRDYTGVAPLRRVSFRNFRQAKSRIVSDVYIMTNVGLENEFYDKSLSGKAVAFVTTKKDFTWKGIKAINDPNVLADAWMETRGKEDANKLDEVVKVVKLDPIGVSFLDYIDGMSDFRRELINKTGNAKLFSPKGNKYTAARIFMNLLQLDLDLKEAAVNNTTVHGVSLYDGDYINMDENKIQIPINQVEPTIAALDRLLSAAVNKVYGKTEQEKLSLTNSEWGLDGSINITAINNIKESIHSRFNDYLENLTNYKEGSVMADFSNAHSFNLALLFHSYLAEYQQDSKSYVRKSDSESTFLLSFINSALKYYEQSSFKGGIYYTPVYKSSSEGGGIAKAMAYPAINMIDNFTVDVEAQTPDFVITGDALQRLLNGIDQIISGKPNKGTEHPDYSKDNATEMQKAIDAFHYPDYFKDAFEKVVTQINSKLPTEVPVTMAVLMHDIQTQLKQMINRREISVVDPSTQGMYLGIDFIDNATTGVEVILTTLGDVLSASIKQPVTNITFDNINGTTLNSGNFEINLQPYKWMMDTKGQIFYEIINNDDSDDAQKQEKLIELEQQYKQLLVQRDALLNKVLQGVPEGMKKKVKSSIDIILSNDDTNPDLIKARTMVHKAFSRVSQDLNEQWQSLLAEFIANKDKKNNLLHTCNNN